MEQPKITRADLEAMIKLAQAAERGQIRLLGRDLHTTERRWLVRAAFRYKLTPAIGRTEANRRAEFTLQMMDKA